MGASASPDDLFNSADLSDSADSAYFEDSADLSCHAVWCTCVVFQGVSIYMGSFKTSLYTCMWKGPVCMVFQGVFTHVVFQRIFLVTLPDLADSGISDGPDLLADSAVCAGSFDDAKTDMDMHCEQSLMS